jgi:hypothetical protein
METPLVLEENKNWYSIYTPPLAGCTPLLFSDHPIWFSTIVYLQNKSVVVPHGQSWIRI